MNRTITTHQLQSAGIMVRNAANSAAAAIALGAAEARGDRFDVIVLDMVMPDTDGIELAGAMRALPSVRDVPIVLLTSGKDVAIDVRAVSGVRACLRKPVRKPHLIDTLKKVISGQTPPDVAKAEPKCVVRVLLAEDNPTNQRVLCLLLHKSGCSSVDAVQNGAEAVEAVAAESYDIVFIDCQMPVLDGYEATRRIRQRGGPQPVVVALTASAVAGERERCLDAGMDDYVTKPVRSSDLRGVLARWCESRQIAPAACGNQAQLDNELAEFLADVGVEEGGEFLRSFARRATGEVDALHAFAASGDLIAVARAVHKLRGTAAMFGLREWTNTLLRAEEQSRLGDTSGLDVSIQQFAVLADGCPQWAEQALQRHREDCCLAPHDAVV